MSPEPYYADDRATLYRGDALAVLAALPTASVDALMADPPYSSGGMVRSDRTAPAEHGKYSGTAKVQLFAEFTGDSRDQRGFGYWCALWLSEALRVVKPGGVACIFTDWRQLPTTSDAIQAGGFVWRGLVPWAKPGYRPQSGRFAAQCEYVVWASNGPMPVDHSAACLPGFFNAAVPPSKGREHLSQKPVEVMRELVKIAPVGGTILDPFMGSGTTGVAALIEGRRFIGAEMTEHYAAIAERRIRTAAGQAIGKGDQSALDFGESA